MMTKNLIIIRNKLYMIKKVFLIIFVMLFALQTSAAMMDEYQPHDKNDHSSSFDHGLDSDKYKQKQLMALDKNLTEEQGDNHHCCHCHANMQITSDHIIRFTLENKTNSLFEFEFIYPLVALSTNLRPPKHKSFS